MAASAIFAALDCSMTRVASDARYAPSSVEVVVKMPVERGLRYACLSISRPSFHSLRVCSAPSRSQPVSRGGGYYVLVSVLRPRCKPCHVEGAGSGWGEVPPRHAVIWSKRRPSGVASVRARATGGRAASFCAVVKLDLRARGLLAGAVSVSVASLAAVAISASVSGSTSPGRSWGASKVIQGHPRS